MKKRRQGRFFTKSRKYFRYPGCQCRLKYEAFSTLRHAILWFPKTIKSTLKICFANMWNQLQDRTPHLFSCLSMCHHPSQYFFEAPPKRVSLRHHSSNLIIHFFINDLLLSMFIQARHTERRIWAKNSIFVYTL